jgi:hypothetical protein
MTRQLSPANLACSAHNCVHTSAPDDNPNVPLSPAHDPPTFHLESLMTCTFVNRTLVIHDYSVMKKRTFMPPDYYPKAKIR